MIRKTVQLERRFKTAKVLLRPIKIGIQEIGLSLARKGEHTFLHPVACTTPAFGLPDATVNDEFA